MNKKLILNIILFSVVNISGWIYAYHLGWVSLDENALIENLEAGTTFAASILFLITAIRSKVFIKRLFNLSFAWLFFNFFFREIDLRHTSFEFSEIIMWLRHGAGYYIFHAAIWLALTVTVIKNGKLFLKECKDWLYTPAAWTIIAAGIFLLLTLPFDKKIFPFPEEVLVMWEEIIEINAYFLILIAAGIHFKKTLS